MISWEEYIKNNILDFRKRYKKVPKKARELIEAGTFGYVTKLARTCQIVVIDFADRPLTFVITNVDDHPDMETIVFKNVKFEDFLDRVPKESHLMALLNPEEIDRTTDYLRKILPKTVVGWTNLVGETANLLFISFGVSIPRRGFVLADLFFREIEFALNELGREKQKKKIEETVDDLRRDAEAIPVSLELRNKIIKNTQRLDSQIDQLHDKVEEEIGAIRKLIGSVKSIQDWKLLVSDVDRLKGEHVPREVFDTEVKRIDEKIDKGIESLNTRIEDLKAIKFWSKRTLLEIVLAITAVIATLYGAGVIKF